ncbi:MAG TPA: hypothetical protein VN715_09220 [Roseiarcus sp.]|nr:hypothetical protein [Roseiarcus sp.]
MNSIWLAALVAVVVFAAGMIGHEIQRRIPESWTTGGPRDALGAVSGLFGLLLALVLGLLIWTAFGVYSTQKATMQTVALNLYKLESALKEYGPETADFRKQLEAGVHRAIADTWGKREGEDFAVNVFRQALSGYKAREAYLDSLKPTSEAQKLALAMAKAASPALSQARAQMALALIEPISYPLLSLVVGWATVLFFAYGLMTKRHPMTLLTFAVGGIGIASAIYLILGFSDPYVGLFQLSPAPIEAAMRAAAD